MIWILLAITLISWVSAVRLYLSRERFKASLTCALVKVREQANTILALTSAQKPLTPQPPKAQDVAKRYSGAQLRRMADQINITAPELTNSEILRESNG